MMFEKDVQYKVCSKCTAHYTGDRCGFCCPEQNTKSQVIEQLCNKEKTEYVQELIKLVGNSVTELLLKKNKDYGYSVFDPPVFAPDMSPKDAILVRMGDKVKRIANLSKTSTTPEVDESISDSMKDLCGYSILWLVQDIMEKSNAIPRN